VYTDIDANTEQNVILPLAEIFRTNNYEILPVLRTLFKSAHFYDARNMGALIKSPAEHLFGLWRCLGVDSPPTSDLLKNYQIHSAMLWHMAEMGLEIGDPPNVAGWPAYYQAPQYDQSWITTDTITKRAITSDSLIFWGYWINSDLQIKANLPDFVATLDNPADPTSLLVESSQLLLGMEISAAMIESLKSILLSGQTADGYWTGAWNAYKNDPEDENNKQIVATRLQATFQRLLQLAEFHLK
jgi:hypothetical protein